MKEKEENAVRLQKLIDEADGNQKAMLEIGKWYLEGVVVKDWTAAEAWLTRAMEMEENVLSVQAMELFIRTIEGKAQILTDEDYIEIKRRLSSAPVQEREYLQELERAGRKEREKPESM